jgi:predicted phosphodiesterase
MPRRSTRAAIAAVLLLLVSPVIAQGPGPGGGPGGRQGGPPQPGIFKTDVAEPEASVVLCRPTDRSVGLSVLLRAGASVRVEYRTAGASAWKRGPERALQSGEPALLELAGLTPDTAYEYRVARSDAGPALPQAGLAGSFHTCRKRGSSFTFTVTADSHLDGASDPETYRTCLRNAGADKPDFHIDLGDTFMAGKHADRASAARQYTAQRTYLSALCSAAPLFLVVGNHDGEEQDRGPHSGGGGTPLPVWSVLRRKLLFPNPIPNAFYSGNASPHKQAGLLENWYAWEWGDALFVVLDPYWTSRSVRGGSEPWNMTLGTEQYDWLAKTLRSSSARTKFVFVHQLTGGIGNGARGGVEAAGLYEWGGKDRNGAWRFDEKRPGWAQPIHALMVKAGVTILFQGHDHLFARQELDGVVYQSTPSPADPTYTAFNEDAYQTGTALPNSGHLIVHVGPAGVRVDYLRAYLEKDETGERKNGQVAHSYTVAAKAKRP